MRPLLTLFVILITGCAHRAAKKIELPSQQKKVTKTPTQRINSFTHQTQKLALDKAIAKPKELYQTNFLRVNDTKKVSFWINYYGKKNKEQFERFSKNGERYRTMVEGIFTRYGLPKELYYVGIVESGFQNHARSHADAVGPWQFIKATAKRYGLKVNHSIDERKNIYKATEAAALYFQDLYNIFGSWELALAGYNAGEYGIIRRIRKANTRNYNELSKLKVIPKDTRNYIPQIIAVMTLDRNKTKYGLTYRRQRQGVFNNLSAKKLYKKIHLKKISKKLGLNYHTLRALNQDLKHAIIPAKPFSPIDIIIPKTSSKRFKKAYSSAALPRKKNNIHLNSKKQIHIVRKNESLYSIAKRYNGQVEDIKKYNRLTKNIIHPGQVLKLPFKQYSQIKYSYIVKRGDNLHKISDQFKTSISHLKRINRLKKSKIYVGQTIKTPPHKKQLYYVKRGDHLSRVSQLFKTDIKTLKSLNHIKDTIYPGQKLIVKITPIKK